MPRQERVPLLRMRAAGQDSVHEGGGLGADGRPPGEEPRRRPLPVLLVGFGHVGRDGGVPPADVAPSVGGDPLAPREDLHRQSRDTDVDLRVDERMGHRVVVMINLYMVVDVDLGELPHPVDEGRRGQRAQRGLIEPQEELPPARLVVAHPAAVQVVEQCADPGVQGGQRVERLVPESREDPAFRHLHRDLDLPLVPGLLRPGGEDRGAHMRRELLVRLLEAGLVPARERDAALQLVAHHRRADAPKEGEHPGVAPEPVGELLRGGRLGVGVIARPEDADEELDLRDGPARGIDEVRLLAGVIDEDLLAGAVLLAHREPVPGEPLAVEVAEPGVAVAGGMLLEVLQVEQFQGDAGLLPLGVEVGTVRQRPGRPRRRRGPVETGLQDVIGHRLDLRPIQAGMGGPAEHAGHRPDADLETGRHLSVAAAQGPLLSEDLAKLAHGQSLGRHPAPFHSGWRAGPSNVAVRLGTRSMPRGSPILRSSSRCSR